MVGFLYLHPLPDGDSQSDTDHPASKGTGDPTMNVVDLFAGPGGWDVAARELGIEPLGIEWDDAACATRKAAGLRTEQADVAALDPMAYGPVEGLIASPPCQAWSMAGKRGGERDKHMVYSCADELAAGDDLRKTYADLCEDSRSMLVVEPVRWVNALRPEWIALEQVPPVLELWQHFAFIFRSWGYNVWTGVVNAANYGVPQTRQRAILLARSDGRVSPPAPTHCQGGSGPSMFGPGLSPWVSMAAALGWNETSALRHPRGIGMVERHGPRADKPASAEAMTVTSKARSWVMTRPATTIMAGHNRSSTELPNGSDASAVRVSLEEAAILQSFPPDYPWQGSRTKQFEQIGNAIPPRLAYALLSAVTGLAGEVAA